MSEVESGTGPAAVHANRLISETSPYLLQHAHNPVDWYPWGPEAFEKARTEDKPILLSVGYSACHWCHVMAHESFEDEDTARLINEHFVSVKVDREERPDVDALYMDAVQALTGNGGWPMTVFLMPDGAPFYGGTYFPPQDRFGMPGFPRVLRSVAGWWATRREDLERQAAEFREWYRKQGELRIEAPPDLQTARVEIAPDVLDAAAEHLLGEMDAVNGGFGRAPKFPHPMALEFLLRVASRRRGSRAGVAESQSDDRLVRLARVTLDKMAAGGIYDQIGGGFHRYSTDATWLVPHFEKMLYDNALLAPVYLHAWQLTGEDSYRRVCEETLEYVLSEMTDPLGGFYSTQDADSEGSEGKFYVWTPAELRAELGEDDAEIAERAWGVTHHGNFEGANILHVEEDVDAVAAILGVSAERVHDALARARVKLYAARAQRVWPGRDDKVLTAWNGFMLRAMAEAGRILGRDDYLAASRKNADFILEHLVRDGRLLRTWRAGHAKIEAYLDDHAALVNGLLSLYEATGDARYFAEARRWADVLQERFWSDDAGGFFDAAHDAETLIGRPRELTDNATPSGASLATEGLLRLAALTGEGRYREVAARVLVPLVPAIARQPSAFGHLLGALDDLIGPFYEVAIVVSDAATGKEAMLRALAAAYRPRMVIAVGSGEDESRDAVPLLLGRTEIEGKATAYVCQGFVCRQPLTDPDALEGLLDT